VIPIWAQRSLVTAIF